MLLKLGWYFEAFVYFNAMTIAEICLGNYQKNRKGRSQLPRKALSKSKKPEVRTKKENWSQFPRLI
ncbi:hypothetical protein CP500_009710 [Tychonema bourrellyi FEM_GT703]|uniref:Uncharacterized protein n=1 Tax=Tychonema bourrellyi FEM_GT703 TaxID=2040638 RepID=A0A2G4F1N2_9CYAN|nr:hypothetical protein CP500_009710 [Tychonema bourrellyi FEM_GT703]